MKFSFHARVASEFLGTGFLVAAVVGSGIMGERLAGGNVAIALLANTNSNRVLNFGGSYPDVRFHFWRTFEPGRDIGRSGRARNSLVRGSWSILELNVFGAMVGAVLAHLMFGLRWYSPSSHVRHGWSLVLSEFVATFGLVMVIWGSSRLRSNTVPCAVACYITAAYWFTASTSFANPAVTIARSLSETGLQEFGPQMFHPLSSRNLQGRLPRRCYFVGWFLRRARFRPSSLPPPVIGRNSEI